MITASGDPAAAIKLSISAWLTKLALNADLCGCDAEERDDIAESIDEVRGIARWPGLSLLIDCREPIGDMIEGDIDWLDSAASESLRTLLVSFVCSVIFLSFWLTSPAVRFVNASDVFGGIGLVLEGGVGNAAWAISLIVDKFSSGEVVVDELGDAVLWDKLESVR